jgi:dihydrofolate reductase
MDEANGIGRDGQLPWHLSDDLKNFRRLTMGHHLILGRKTFDSIGTLLPGRTLIVLSRNPDFSAEGTLSANSLEEALTMARKFGEEELFVIGGAEIFALALLLADRFYLTRVHVEVEVDTRFPEFDISEWEELSSESVEAGPKNDHAYTILNLQKR